MNVVAADGPADGPLRVLLTNNGYVHRAGSELHKRDLAIELTRRGHFPILFSSDLGEISDELRHLYVPAISDPALLTVPPDIIHSAHHLDAMTALLWFPQVPAIHVVHGWEPWEEQPPWFPSIRAYVAVDLLCRERLLTSGIPDEQITVIPPPVDLRRFPLRQRLATRPRRALVFGNTATAGDDYSGAILAACSTQGIDVTFMGAGTGTASSAPEDALPDYDLVFGKGRCAAEAAASGAAVVVADPVGIGGMVAPADVAEVIAENFGFRLLQRHPVTVDAIVAQIRRYDPVAAGEVTRTVRSELDVATIVTRWEELYRRVLSDHPPVADIGQLQLQASSRYLRSLTPLLKSGHSLRSQLAEARLSATELQEQVERIRAENAALREDMAPLTVRLQDAEARLSQMLGSRAHRAAQRLTLLRKQHSH